MKFFTYISTSLICLLLTISGFAQPSNDNCENARELTNLNNGCANVNFLGATFDKTSGTCTQNDFPNTWFEFTAQGNDVELQVLIAQSVDAYITLWDVDQAENCNDTLWDEELCSTNILAVGNRLEIGKKYLVSVAFQSPGIGNYQLCINNPVPSMIPPNDHPCSAPFITPDGSCYSGHNNNSNPDWNNPECSNASGATVWYKLFLTPGHTSLNVTLQPGFTGNYSMFLCRFNNNRCNSYPIIVGDTVFCDNLPDRDTITFTNLSANTVYYLQIASRSNATGTFTFCTTEIPDPSGCGLNDDCLDAMTIVAPEIEPDTLCFSGCNASANPGPMDMPGTCYFMEHPTTWHTIEPDPVASVMRINISSSELQHLQVGIYTGDTCADLTPFLCDYSTDGFLEFVLFETNLVPRYYLAISDLFGAEGEYDICVDQFILETNCNLVNSLRVTNTSFGSPLEGPYQSGESVTFCYQISAWQKVNCNWLQGISPQFGSAWDPASFRISGEPVNVTTDLQAHTNGNWRWYSEGSVDYNFENFAKGYTIGSPLPGGWYFTNNNFNPNNPDLSRGDAITCGLESGLDWEVCFSLRVKDFEECMELDGDDASVRIETFSDSEIGLPLPQGCEMDFATLFVGTLKCCEGPSIADAIFNACSGSTFVYDLNPNNDPELNFSWEVIVPAGVFGPEAGTGDVINQEITNFTNERQQVLYLVSVSDSDGCFGQPATITVNVESRVIADAGDDMEVCEGTSVRLGGSPTATGGSGNYNYNWSNGSGNQSNPFYTATEDETIRLVATDSRGCRGVDSIELSILPMGSSAVNISICAGDTFFFFGQTITTTGNYDHVINNGSANGCDSTVTAVVVTYPEIDLEDFEITPDNGTNSGTVRVDIGGGTSPYVINWSNGGMGEMISGLTSGIYTASVTDAEGCEKTFDFNVPLMSGSRERELYGQISLAPNPVRNGQTWRIDNHSQFDLEKVTILSTRGQVIQSIEPDMTRGTIEIPTSTLAAGLYLIRMEIDGLQVYKKLIVQH